MRNQSTRVSPIRLAAPAVRKSRRLAVSFQISLLPLSVSMMTPKRHRLKPVPDLRAQNGRGCSPAYHEKRWSAQACPTVTPKPVSQSCFAAGQTTQDDGLPYGTQNAL